MTKEQLLKRIVEDSKFKKKYWPNFKTDPKIFDYQPSILQSKNRYLMALRVIVIEADSTLTDNIKYKQILNSFEL